MKKFIFNSMLVGGLMMASCSDDVFDAPVQEDVNKDFAQSFVEKFGSIHPDQDWNMAEGKSISINSVSRAGGDVKIYAKYQGVFRLVAHYENVPADGKCDFTAPKGADEFLVKKDGQVCYVGNGGTADFAAALSRTYFDEEANVFEVYEGYKEFATADVMGTITTAQRSGTAWTGSLVHNFQFYNNGNDGKVTVYPIYRNSNPYEYHVFGIYYHGENNEKIYKPIYSSEDGEDLLYNGVAISGSNAWDDSVWEQKGPGNIQSRGFEVTLKNTSFGFYVDVYQKTVYGDAKLYTWHSVAADDADYMGNWIGKMGHSHIKMYNQLPYWPWFLSDIDKMICVESRIYQGPMWNDLYFAVDVNEPSDITTENPQEYILAVEDLGSNDDYDFNDVVFSVSHVAGQTKAQVTALAAGGTLPVQLYRDGKAIDGEFHSWFEGENAAVGGKYPMINTTSGQAYVAGKTVEITVPSDFRLETKQNEVPMGGFKVMVNGDEKMEITAPQKGAAPQMICVPTSWRWMQERKSIDLGYTLFGDYGSGYVTADWLNTGIDTEFMYEPAI